MVVSLRSLLTVLERLTALTLRDRKWSNLLDFHLAELSHRRLSVDLAPSAGGGTDRGIYRLRRRSFRPGTRDDLIAGDLTVAHAKFVLKLDARQKSRVVD